jgi:hypothetical protein
VIRARPVTAVVAVLVLAVTGTLTAAAPARTSLEGAAVSVRAELRGLRQRGLVLGRRSARVTVVEYADLICPACAAVSTAVLPAIIAHFVRPGIASIDFEPLSDSPRSDRLALGAYSAGVQRAGWDFVQLVYLRRGGSSGGPLEPAGDLVSALRLDRARWRSHLRRRRWANAIQGAATIAVVGGFTTFPVFVVRRAGKRARATILTPPISLARLSAAITAARHSRR